MLRFQMHYTPSPLNLDSRNETCIVWLVPQCLIHWATLTALVCFPRQNLLWSPTSYVAQTILELVCLPQPPCMYQDTQPLSPGVTLFLTTRLSYSFRCHVPLSFSCHAHPSMCVFTASVFHFLISYSGWRQLRTHQFKDPSCFSRGSRFEARMALHSCL